VEKAESESGFGNWQCTHLQQFLLLQALLLREFSGPVTAETVRRIEANEKEKEKENENER
tara:strand:+ start:508 stop:687 length:180 start_codon:yes stop_codon:yes gene_type:complete